MIMMWIVFYSAGVYSTVISTPLPNFTWFTMIDGFRLSVRQQSTLMTTPNHWELEPACRLLPSKLAIVIYCEYLALKFARKCYMRLLHFFVKTVATVVAVAACGIHLNETVTL